MAGRTDEKTKRVGKIYPLVIAAIISVIFMISLLGFVLCYYFVPRDVGSVTVTVPKFVGRHSENTPDMQGDFDVLREYAWSDTADEGEIISQTPPPGAKRKLMTGERCSVCVTVSLGKHQNKMPDLHGMQYLSAAAVLRELGARVRVVPVYDSGLSRGTVTDTNPKRNSAISAGQSVTLFVARDRINGSVCVPDFRGMDMVSACRELLSKGLTVGEIIEVDGDTEGSCTVLEQSLIADTYVKYGSSIDLYVGTAEADGEGDEQPPTESSDDKRGYTRDNEEDNGKKERKSRGLWWFFGTR